MEELRGKHYSNSLPVEVRVAACMSYLLTGSINKAAQDVGVSQQVAQRWRHEEWWEPTLLVCRRKKQDELDSVLTDVIHKAIGELSDRVSEGDVRLTRDGTAQRIPMSGKDLAIAMSVLFDKRALIRGEPTSRPESSSEQTRLDTLQKQFEEMSRQFNMKTVEGTCTEILGKGEDYGDSEEEKDRK